MAKRVMTTNPSSHSQFAPPSASISLTHGSAMPHDFGLPSEPPQSDCRDDRDHGQHVPLVTLPAAAGRFLRSPFFYSTRLARVARLGRGRSTGGQDLRFGKSHNLFNVGVGNSGPQQNPPGRSITQQSPDLGNAVIRVAGATCTIVSGDPSIAQYDPITRAPSASICSRMARRCRTIWACQASQPIPSAATSAITTNTFHS